MTQPVVKIINTKYQSQPYSLKVILFIEEATNVWVCASIEKNLVSSGSSEEEALNNFYALIGSYINLADEENTGLFDGVDRSSEKVRDMFGKYLNVNTNTHSPEKEKYLQWYKKETENGLISIHLSLNEEIPPKDEEEVYKALNAMNQSVAEGCTTPLTNI